MRTVAVSDFFRDQRVPSPASKCYTSHSDRLFFSFHLAAGNSSSAQISGSLRQFSSDFSPSAPCTAKVSPTPLGLGAQPDMVCLQPQTSQCHNASLDLHRLFCPCCSPSSWQIHLGWNTLSIFCSFFQLSKKENPPGLGPPGIFSHPFQA